MSEAVVNFRMHTPASKILPLLYNPVPESLPLLHS